MSLPTCVIVPQFLIVLMCRRRIESPGRLIESCGRAGKPQQLQLQRIALVITRAHAIATIDDVLAGAYQRS